MMPKILTGIPVTAFEAFTLILPVINKAIDAITVTVMNTYIIYFLEGVSVLTFLYL